jgi:hypothetical protein
MPYHELRIIALKTFGEWSASFADDPATGYGGATPRDAARRLLSASRRVDLDTDYLIEGTAVELDERLDLVIRVFRR